jgi:rod shape-determining protein MreB
MLTGRDARSSAPRQETFDLDELDAVLEQVARPVLEAAARCIAEAPPDLANDLLRCGLLLAGGGGRIAGFEQRLARATGIPIHIPPGAELLAVRGALRCAAEVPTGLPVSLPRPR